MWSHTEISRHPTVDSALVNRIYVVSLYLLLPEFLTLTSTWRLLGLKFEIT